jgi:hypothetical protein
MRTDGYLNYQNNILCQTGKISSIYPVPIIMEQLPLSNAIEKPVMCDDTKPRGETNLKFLSR